MSADVNALIDKMVADASQKIKTDLKNISSQAKRDFIAKSKEVVLLYYAHYTPKVYQRIYNLRDNVIEEDPSFAVLSRGAYGAWVQFNSNNMSEYDIGNKDAVVDNFMYGIHGRKKIFVEPNPAIELMNEFQQGYKTTLDSYFLNLGYTVK